MHSRQLDANSKHLFLPIMLVDVSSWVAGYANLSSRLAHTSGLHGFFLLLVDAFFRAALLTCQAGLFTLRRYQPRRVY
jgi:hypothetical protein